MFNSSDQNKTKQNICSFTISIAIITVFISLLGFILFIFTYKPLSKHRIHDKEAIIIYKCINIFGLVLIPLSIVVGVILMMFVKCKLASNETPSPQQAIEEEYKAASKRILQTKNQMEWNAIKEPNYEYMSELILAFAREKSKGKEIIDV